MKEEIIKITLPLPPSVNGLYKNAKKGRIKTDKYKAFEEHVSLCFIKMDTKYQITGNKWLFAEYTYYMPIYNKNGSIKKIDVENRIKATSDVLGKNIPGFDDSKIKKLLTSKVDSNRNEVDIMIREING